MVPVPPQDVKPKHKFLRKQHDINDMNLRASKHERLKPILARPSELVIPFIPNGGKSDTRI